MIEAQIIFVFGFLIKEFNYGLTIIPFFYYFFNLLNNLIMDY